MKKWIVVGMVMAGIFLVQNSHAQKDDAKKKGSYEKYRSKSSVSSMSAPDLLEDADDLKSSNPSEALNRVKEALATSIAQGDEQTEAKCYVLLGEINESISEWTLAQENYQRSYDILSGKKSNAPEFKRTLQGLGNSNLKLGKHEDALRFYNEMLSQRLSTTEKDNCRLDKSEVYYQMGNYDDALKIVESISAPKKISNPSFETRVQNQKAKILARMNELDQSQTILQNTFNKGEAGKAPDPLEKQSVQETKEEVANALRSQKKYDDEISLRNQSVDYNLKLNDLTEVTKDKVEISNTLAAKGENSAALKELEEAVEIADTLNDPKAQALAFLALAGQYEKNGRNKEALSAYRKYSEAVSKNEKLNEAQLAEKSGLLRQQKDIEELSKDVSIGKREETIERGMVERQQLVIYGLLAIILIVVITSYFIYKNAQASKKANQLLALKSLRSQMNPHFIFNALNSVNHFIAQQDERTANKFLSEFSQLMRLVLENSQEDFISLQREQEILSLYLKLEHYRFRDKFDYEIEVDESINSEAIEVPPMLIQPYIENAVWHGLRYKEEKGKLVLRLRKEASDLVIEVYDNGIGRTKSQELKTKNQKKHNSTGLKNIQERLGIINRVYKANYRVAVTDAETGTGTLVKIYLPMNHVNG